MNKMRMLFVSATLIISLMATSCGRKEIKSVNVSEDTGSVVADDTGAIENTETIDESKNNDGTGANDENDTIVDTEVINEYATIFLDKVLEYNESGKADGFDLVDVNGDETPELIAADSEGNLEEDGNVHLFIAYDGGITELLSLNSGYDGTHMYISEGDNFILETGSMSGNENYITQCINGNKLEIMKDLHMVFDIMNDSYTYYDGETEISEDQYFNKFEDSISVNNPYKAFDFDGIKKVTISIKDGYTDIQSEEAEAYKSCDEMKELLIGMGASNN